MMRCGITASPCSDYCHRYLPVDFTSQAYIGTSFEDYARNAMFVN